MKNIGHEINKIKTESCFLLFKKIISFILIILIFLPLYAWNIYISSGDIISKKTLYGSLEGIHHQQTNTGSSNLKLSIKLESGKFILVNAPNSLPVKHKAKVEIKRIEKETGSVNYSFIKYSNLQ